MDPIYLFDPEKFRDYLPPALGTVCAFCGFERKAGDVHQVWFDGMPITDPAKAHDRRHLPSFGCGIAMETHNPRPLGIITSDHLTP